MIWPQEAVLLAGTKLKTRKIRLIITIVITSLMFGVLIFLASITEGSIHSIKSFGEEGYGRKYYVQATPLTYLNSPGTNQEIKDHFGSQQRDLVARKKASAKKLNITYDETTDMSLPINTVQVSGDNNGIPSNFANFSSPMVADYLNKKNASIPGTSYEDFTKVARQAGAKKVYSGTASGGLAFSFVGSSGAGQVSVLIDGKEDYSKLAGITTGQPDITGIASISTIGWRSSDGELLRPFVLPGQNLENGSDQSVPIIAPYSAAEEILKLKPLPQTATSDEKLNRLVEVRKGIAGKSAELCYRNTASNELLTQALQQQKDIESNKNNKDYVKPSLIYQLPVTGCGGVTIKSDKRSADEKKEAAKKKAFDIEFGQYTELEQGIISIRIIGINPDIGYSPSISANSILTSLFTSSLGAGGWISPAKAVMDNKLATKVQGGTAIDAPRTNVIYFAQFDALAEVENFIKNQTCDGLVGIQGIGGSNQSIDVSPGQTTTTNCINQKKVLSVTPYGNSAGAIEHFRAGIWKFARFAVLVIVVLATLVMMGNVGKIIADSRRETAVFRSLGAKRLDIAEIYLTYTILISAIVAVFSLLSGSAVAIMLSNHFSPSLSVAAVLTYNAKDVHKQFTLYGFNSTYILVICCMIVVAGLLSASLPLMTNTRRNPIRDMRDES